MPKPEPSSGLTPYTGRQPDLLDQLLKDKGFRQEATAEGE